MSSTYNAALRLLAVCTLVILSFMTIAQAQPTDRRPRRS